MLEEEKLLATTPPPAARVLPVARRSAIVRGDYCAAPPRADIPPLARESHASDTGFSWPISDCGVRSRPVSSWAAARWRILGRRR